MAFKFGDLIGPPAQPKPSTWVERETCNVQGKMMFPSKADATKWVKRINTVHRTPMTPYRCPYCDHWHLGHGKGKVF